MFIVMLRFNGKKQAAADFVEGHVSWLKQGFDDQVFVLAGSLANDQGGGILVNIRSRDELWSRLDDDPFIREKVVTAEVIELMPAMTDPRLGFLLENR